MENHIYWTSVRPEHIDVYHHLNNSNYSVYFAEAERDYVIKHEPSMRSLFFVSSSSEYKFFKQVMPSDSLEIRTRISQENGILILNQEMFAKENLATSLKISRNIIPILSDYVNIGNIEIEMARIFETGRIDAQGINRLTDSDVIAKKFMLVVYSAKHESGSSIILNSALTTSQISLESRFRIHERGPKIVLEQRIYNGEISHQNELAKSLSEHVFIDAVTGKPLLHPEDVFELDSISRNKCVRYIERGNIL